MVQDARGVHGTFDVVACRNKIEGIYYNTATIDTLLRRI